MKKFLTISEMAKYAGISRRTLIYYDQIDLFKPAKVGENGYRYYGIDQYFELDVILLLKNLDVSLEDIHVFLKIGMWITFLMDLCDRNRRLMNKSKN